MTNLNVNTNPTQGALPTTPTVAHQSTEGRGTHGGAWRMVLAMLLSGTIGLVVIESGLPVELVVLLRCLLGALGLGLWLVWRRGWAKPTAADWRYMLLGGLALVGNWVALFHAYQYVGIAVATVVYHVQPFLLVLAAALTGEAVRLRQLPWLLLALAGVVLTSGVGAKEAAGTLQHSAGLPVWGILLALLAAMLYTATVVATRRVKNIEPTQIALVQMLAGGAALGIYMLPSLMHGLLGLVQDDTHSQLAKTVACVLVLGLVHTALMYGLMYGAFQRLGATAIAMLSFIYPAIALAVDLLWFSTRPSAEQWLGMGVIALAVLGYRWQDLRKPA